MIQEDVFNSDIDVSVALESYLDKVCTMLEYAGYTDYTDDLIAEMFDVYLEATDRRKKADEIDKYLTDKNVANAKAKNPNKARKARQIRNFLITNDFDPKTETIKGDYTDKSGKNNRINFSISTTPDKFFRDQRMDYSDAEKDLINLDHRTLRNDKKSANAFTVAHEKGHNLFNKTGQSDKWTAKEDKNERGIKFIDQAKASGKDINSHDDGSYIIKNRARINGNTDIDVPSFQSPEELEADLHAGKTARVRTKYAGSKRAVKRSGATRNINDREIQGAYKRFQHGDGVEFRDTDFKSGDYFEMSKARLSLQTLYYNISDAIESFREDTGSFHKIFNDVKEYYNDHIKDFEYLTNAKIKKHSNDKIIDAILKLIEGAKFIHDLYMKNIDDMTIKNQYSSKILNMFNPQFMKYYDDKVDPKTVVKKFHELIYKDKETAKRRYSSKHPDQPMNDSTQMRHDFVKQYLHEYFIEFMTEYYSSIFNE